MSQPPASVYIVTPATDSNTSALKYETAFPALAPLALGTWLQERLPDLRVLARDGNTLGQEAILEEIEREQPSVVAVSALGMNYQNCLRIAETSKQMGSLVVFGNDHAAQLSHLILQARPAVDYVICSEYGELSLELLLRHLRGDGHALEDVPFLTYRQADGEVAGYRYMSRDNSRGPEFLEPYMRGPRSMGAKRATLDEFPVIDRRLYPEEIWRRCTDNFKRSTDAALIRGDIQGVTTMNRIRGCSRAKRPCSFCNILSLDPRLSSPELFWAEIAAAYEDVSATVFYEVCDSFTSFCGLIERLLRSRPVLSFEPQMIVYGQALEVARRASLPAMLKDLGVFKINMGLESGCDVTLRHMKGPHDSTEINREALHALKAADLHVYASFVLGSAAESPRTLAETRDWIISVLDDDLIDDVEVQPVLPYIGNQEGNILSDMGLFQVDPDNPDWPPDTDELSRIFIETVSGVSYGMVCEVVEEIHEYARRLGKTSCSAVMRSELALASSVSREVASEASGQA